MSHSVDLELDITPRTTAFVTCPGDHLGAEIGMTSVLHTHSRRLDYHPHLHVIIPGGGVSKTRKQ